MDLKRLVIEARAMQERWAPLCPRLRLDPAAANTRPESLGWESLRWDVEIRGEGGNALPISILYPPAYPAEAPTIVSRVEFPPGTPHLLSGRRLCWIYPSEDARHKNMWDPAHDTAAMCVGVACRWFLAFIVWMSTQSWPVPDARS